ncbi:MAG TPA: hypothetical protein VHV78_17550 [Gemmatimonadaceae bacterium]|nr:hypothetical protein [Gemmatimonadaceae bacterium]
MQFSNLSGARRAAAAFYVDQDAYVLVGHIDADGVLRIIFPATPQDDGLVKGQQEYRTQEFFAGFLADYRQRYQAGGFRSAVPPTDSYDGGLGYAFVIASWRPMHFDRFATNGTWDSFELTDEDYLTDPRPAIYELASLLSGENREAYTVKFARYTSSQELYGSGFANSAFDSFGSSAYCAGYEPLGFELSSPFGVYGPTAAGALWGDNFSYRGTNYYYDQSQGCYTSGFGFGGLGYGYVLPPIRPTTPRIFNITSRLPHPLPQGNGFKLPTSTTPADAHVTRGAAPLLVHTSPQYRDRGLLTTEEPSTGDPEHPTSAFDSRKPLAEHTRPSIQQMVNSRDNGDGSGWARSSTAGETRRHQNADGSAQRAARAGDDQAHQRQSSSDNGTRSTESHPAPSYTPRSAPPSSPPPARASSPPPSSGSSSGGPIKP